MSADRGGRGGFQQLIFNARHAAVISVMSALPCDRVFRLWLSSSSRPPRPTQCRTEAAVYFASTSVLAIDLECGSVRLLDSLRHCLGSLGQGEEDSRTHGVLVGDNGMGACRLLTIARVPLPPVTGAYEIQGTPSLPQTPGKTTHRLD